MKILNLITILPLAIFIFTAQNGLSSTSGEVYNFRNYQASAVTKCPETTNSDSRCVLVKRLSERENGEDKMIFMRFPSEDKAIIGLGILKRKSRIGSMAVAAYSARKVRNNQFLMNYEDALFSTHENRLPHTIVRDVNRSRTNQLVIECRSNRSWGQAGFDLIGVSDNCPQDEIALQVEAERNPQYLRILGNGRRATIRGAASSIEE